ncbi:MAG: hypothetical protein SNJ74_11470 [Fimbriimonadaceae bacterium]
MRKTLADMFRRSIESSRPQGPASTCPLPTARPHREAAESAWLFRRPALAPTGPIGLVAVVLTALVLAGCGLLGAGPLDDEDGFPEVGVREMHVGVASNGVAVRLVLDGGGPELRKALRRQGFRQDGGSLSARRPGEVFEQRLEFREGDPPVFEYVAGNRPDKLQPLPVPASTKFAGLYEPVDVRPLAMTRIRLRVDAGEEEALTELLEAAGRRVFRKPESPIWDMMAVVPDPDGRWLLRFGAVRPAPDPVEPDWPQRWGVMIGVVPITPREPGRPKDGETAAEGRE